MAHQPFDKSEFHDRELISPKESRDEGKTGAGTAISDLQLAPAAKDDKNKQADKEKREELAQAWTIGEAEIQQAREQEKKELGITQAREATLLATLNQGDAIDNNRFAATLSPTSGSSSSSKSSKKNSRRSVSKRASFKVSEGVREATQEAELECSPLRPHSPTKGPKDFQNEKKLREFNETNRLKLNKRYINNERRKTLEDYQTRNLNHKKAEEKIDAMEYAATLSKPRPS